MNLIAFLMALGTGLCGYGLASVMHGKNEMKRIELSENTSEAESQEELKNAADRLKFGKIIIPIGLIVLAFAAYRIFLMVIEPGSQ